MRLALSALERAGDDSDVLWRAGFCISHFGGDVEQSRLIVERALALNGNSAHGIGHSGWIQAYVGCYRTAVERFERAMRLSPVDPIFSLAVYAPRISFWMSSRRRHVGAGKHYHTTRIS
jgi:hypothetical protein